MIKDVGIVLDLRVAPTSLAMLYLLISCLRLFQMELRPALMSAGFVFRAAFFDELARVNASVGGEYELTTESKISLPQACGWRSTN